MPSFVLDSGKLDKAINATGFPTEYKVEKILESHGWKVVPNRYYIDDQKKIEREIDLLASKRGVRLVISCKKSDNCFWTLMTSHSPDCEVPFEYNTKDRVVNYFLRCEQSMFRKIVLNHPCLTKMLNLSENVRAFQEINIASYAKQNDKNIYGSVITTIKAADYEESHSNDDSAYFLLSVFDGEMVQKSFDTGDASIIDEAKNVNRHFVGEKDKYYCVHFIKFDSFDSILSDYDNMVDEIPILIEDLHAEFYSGVFNHRERMNFFLRDFEGDFFDGLYEEYERAGTGFSSLSTNPTDIRPYYGEDGRLHLAFNLSLFTKRKALAKEINRDKFCRGLMKELLKKYYGYEGEFIIENDPEREKAFDMGCI